MKKKCKASTPTISIRKPHGQLTYRLCKISVLAIEYRPLFPPAPPPQGVVPSSPTPEPPPPSPPPPSINRKYRWSGVVVAVDIVL